MPNDNFELDKLNRPATNEEYKGIKKSPCISHDKQTEIAEQVERLKEINKQVLLKDFSKALKHDTGKPEYSNLPRRALLEVVKVMTYGKNNYGKYNYSGSIESSRLSDALERHLNKYLMNEDIDESSYHHLAHVAANALMLLDGILTKQVIDDRNKIYKSNEQ
jgi:hypothetical protein